MPVPWRLIQKENFTNWQLLADYLQLTDSQRAEIITDKIFPLNLPRRLAQKIAKSTLDDPILKQFLPLKLEEVEADGFSTDPVGEQPVRKEERLLHKYHGRALLVCTSACAMHCRYCFRRHFDYAVGNPTFEKELAAIQDDSSLSEVILSGGDPLSLSDNVLTDLMHQLNGIEHVKRIRFHSRFPVGIPERIDDSLIHLLGQSRAQVWFVTHLNHAQELGNDLFSALNRLRKICIPVLNQAVLLRGVNDSVEALATLSLELVDNGIIPYYLHQLDRVQGASHFEVTEEEGLKLIEQLRKKLPGYAVPQYVREDAGEASKTPLGKL